MESEVVLWAVVLFPIYTAELQQFLPADSILRKEHCYGPQKTNYLKALKENMPPHEGWTT